jgi:hypothetical protein
MEFLFFACRHFSNLYSLLSENMEISLFLY